MQKQKPQKPSPKLDIGAEMSRIAKDFCDWPKRFYNEMVFKFGNLSQVNNELGLTLMQRGNFNDAVFRFKLALKLDQNFQMAWYNLGCTQLAIGKVKEAAYSFRRALKLKPGDENTIFMLAIADPASLPKDKFPTSMPLQLIVSQFNGLAPTYDLLQIEEMQYSGHVELNRSIREYLEPNRVDHNILELGCGTGLCGPMLRMISTRLTGVDIASNMVSFASQLRDEANRSVYDSLYTQEMHTYLSGIGEPTWDVVCAANVFNYTGDLSGIFPLALKVLKPGGLFVFSTEIKADPGYSFIPDLGRFAHSPAYVRDLAQKTGFEPLDAKESLMYPTYKSLMCVLRKPK